MSPYLTIQKNVGETPLQALDRLRVIHGIPPDIPLAYAGRLDPMASGTLLVLVGDECKNQYAYHGLDKEYEFEVLFGFETDTGDIMGIPDLGNTAPITLAALKGVVHKMPRTVSLPFPRFSSRTVKGKPLFLWTLEGRLDEIDIPIAHTNIYTLTCTGLRTISSQEAHTSIRTRIQTLPTVTEESKRLGEDFRRGTILPAWESLLKEERPLQVASCKAVVSAGTYIRSLAPYIARLLDTKGLAYSIHRTKMGRYVPLPFLKTGMWIKTYR